MLTSSVSSNGAVMAVASELAVTLTVWKPR
jgi:hypothetical protein